MKIPPVVKASVIEEDIQCEDTNILFDYLKQSGVKGKDRMAAKSRLSASNSFVDYKKNLGGIDMKNFETNIGGSRNLLNNEDKDKKYEDKRKALKEKLVKLENRIGNAAIITKNVEPNTVNLDKIFVR